MKRKKIKNIFWLYPHLNFWMGGTKYLYEVAKRLSAIEGYKVYVICNKADKKIKDKFISANINVICVSFISTNNILYWILFPFVIFADIMIYTKYLLQADTIITTLFPSNLIAAVFSKIYKRRYIYLCYEPFPFFHNKNFMASTGPLKRLLLKILALFYKHLDIWATKKAAKILTLNKITANAIYSTYKTKSTPIYMGVDTKLFKPVKEDKNFFLKRYKDRILIAHSTDYTEMKRTDLSIKVINKLASKYPNLLLIITSTRPEAKEKEKYMSLVKKLGLEDNVLFLGLLDIDKLVHLYSGAVCYLSSSYDTMLGTTSSNLPVKEAMACATPAIRANITDEDVEDGVSGFLVNPLDIDYVAKKIDWLIRNKEESVRMGMRGRKKIKRIYNWDKVVSRIVKNFV